MKTRETRLLSPESIPPNSPAEHNSKAPVRHRCGPHVIHTGDAQSPPKHPLWRKTRTLHGRLSPSTGEHRPTCVETKMSRLSALPRHRRRVSQRGHRSIDPQHETSPTPPRNCQLHKQNASRKKNKTTIQRLHLRVVRHLERHRTRRPIIYDPIHHIRL